MRRALESCGTPLSGKNPPPLTIVASTRWYSFHRSRPPWASRILASSSFIAFSFSPLRGGIWLRESAEGERKSFYARIEKLDLELSVNDGLRLPDQLIEPLFGNRAVALIVHVLS